MRFVFCFYPAQPFSSDAKGGNDYEIFADERTIGHAVNNPEDTYRRLKELFF